MRWFKTLKASTYILVFLITLTSFLPVIQNDFVNWDDEMLVVNNVEIGALSWRSIRWMMTTFYFRVWHPLTWFSHALDRAVWGLDPAYHHLMNAVIHALNALLVMVLFVALTRGRDLSESGRCIGAFAGALLFALHPLRVESVAWISERKDVLCLFFFVSCLIFYLKYARARAGIGIKIDQYASLGFPPPVSPPARGGDIRTLSLSPSGEGVSGASSLDGSGNREGNGVGASRLGGTAPSSLRPRTYYALALGLCFLALLSKPMAVSLPAVLLILDYYPLERLNVDSWRGLLLEKVPFLILSAGAVGMNILAVRGATVPFDYVPLGMRIMNALHAVVFYLRQTVYPANLLPFYQIDRGADYLGPSYVLAALIVVALTACCLARAAKGYRLWAAVWFYYLITLAPAMGLFMTYRHAVADRYTYLPTLGFWLLVGIGVGSLWDKAGASMRRTALRAALMCCLATVALVYDYKTAQQIAVWKDSLRLWTHVLLHSDHVPDSAFFGVGIELERKGLLDQAMGFYQKALSLNPKNPKFIGQMANAIAQKGDTQKALDIYAQMAKAYPRDPLPHFEQGRVLALMGRQEDAVAAFEKALQLASRDERANLLQRLARGAPKDKGKALEYYRRYLAEGYPRDPDIERQVGLESGVQGGKGEATYWSLPTN